MSNISGLLLLVALYILFYLVGDALFHNALVVIFAGIASALVGLLISSLRGQGNRI